ncbi:hypothetical protein [Burkholderia diffusa]|uniref:hypothetical protein n=1 Tax=Burkholderia diffusa TaxID=488732 RepID=UPI000757B8A9|nr:hypothetical protein [Burkholderia diffusa]KVH51165.1 hypothetical protein WJ39_08390 [Burkholderia diffusa]
MKSTDNPARIPTPFALNGNRNAIPEASQISVTKGAASFNDGFPPLTMTDPLQGGIPPFGKDMNGVLFALSAIARWSQAGGGYVYDPTFSGNQNVGGYPKGAILLRSDFSGFWFNTVDNNATNPDATDGSAQGWVPLNADWNASSGPGVILNRPTLATVATSGSYTDLSNTPTIPAAQVNSDWDATSGVAQILNRPTLATVATSGSYSDLSDTPTIPAAQVNSDWNAGSGVAQILNKPTLAAVATSGNYNDLSNQPTLPAAQVNSDWNAGSGVAQILNKPTIPAAQVNADWNATSGVAQILNKPTSLPGTLPVLTIELGNSAQANGGRGIDQGNWYQLDFHVGTNASNGFQYTVNSDGTITIPSGVYLVSGSAKIIAPSNDTYQWPAQMFFGVGQAYAYPGVYQNAVQRYPDMAQGTISTPGGGSIFGPLMLSGVQSFGPGYPLWMGFAKVLGSVNSTPLSLQGYMSIVKIG